jgi:hypothetical protein
VSSASLRRSRSWTPLKRRKLKQWKRHGSKKQTRTPETTPHGAQSQGEDETMRLDIFTKQSGNWTLDALCVTLGNARRIIATLEAQGEYVGAFAAGGTVGLNKYLTGSGWTARRFSGCASPKQFQSAGNRSWTSERLSGDYADVK